MRLVTEFDSGDIVLRLRNAIKTSLLTLCQSCIRNKERYVTCLSSEPRTFQLRTTDIISVSCIYSYTDRNMDIKMDKAEIDT